MSAGSEHGDLVAAGGVKRAARGEHHGGSPVAQSAEQAHHLGGLRRVKSGCGLLKEEQRRCRKQLSRDGRPPAFSGVEAAYQGIRLAREAGNAERFRKSAFIDRHPSERCLVAERPVEREDVVDRLAIGHISDISLHSPDASRAWRPQSRHRIEQRGLARPAAADDRDKLAMTNGQRNIMQGGCTGSGLLTDGTHLDGNPHGHHCVRFSRVSLHGVHAGVSILVE